MRLKKPTRAIIDQVRITREGNDAIIDYADAGIAGTRLTIGPGIATMTDRDIINVFNGILAAQERLLAAWIRRSPKSRRVRNKSTITKRAISGSRAATCSAASSTMAAPREKSPSISTTRSCHSPNSAGCSGFTRVGV
jgi:hypothetical protein